MFADDGVPVSTTNSTPFLLLRPKGPVRALAQSDTTLFFGGLFSVLGSGRQNAMGVLKAGGLASFAPNPDGAVNALMLSGGNVSVGGGFTVLGGSVRGAFGVTDTNGGLLP